MLYDPAGSLSPYHKYYHIVSLSTRTVGHDDPDQPAEAYSSSDKDRGDPQTTSGLTGTLESVGNGTAPWPTTFTMGTDRQNLTTRLDLSQRSSSLTG